MKLTTIISYLAFASSALAAPAPVAEFEERAAPPTNFFGGIVSRSASPIHLLPINANGTHFWIGKKTASYCPRQVVPHCPPGKYTVFAGGFRGPLRLDVEVPGGQQVYIDPTGALSFTVAHSGVIPPGSVISGFTRTPQTSTQPGILHHGGGFFACREPSGAYKVYVGTKDFKRKGCLGFGFLTENIKGYGAWEYT